MEREEEHKSKNWLLTNVPDEIEKIIKEQQDKRKRECGCFCSRSQAIYTLLRRVCKEETGKLQNA